ncbi:MAG: ABC transporter ATP-binding protein, partial [Treponema sp.]|nr:ABC transporter ATP-binding protein [Treponema sp.]
MVKRETKNSAAGIPLEAHVASSKIIAAHIDKVYKSGKKEIKAIDDVTIDIQDNDFVCIVGPSGCGKSTILRMLAGLDFPTKGQIIMDDRNITGPGPDRGMVFQTYTLFPWMSVEDNIKFGLLIKKMPKEEQQEIADRYLEIIGLRKFAKSYPKELSGGMKQRVAIARALANQPEVLLMDEPFGALDPHTKSMMQLLLREIWEKEHPTIVFITHDIDEAVFLADKIYVLSARPG